MDRALYAVEAEVRGQPPDSRHRVRQERSRPLIDTLLDVLDAALRRLSPKSDMAKAIAYATKRWTALSRFLDDGRLEIDNNIAERALRGVAKRRSLCGPCSSVCKHWKRVFVRGATRTYLPGHRRVHARCREIGRADLVRRTRHDLLDRQHAGPDQTTYGMVGDPKRGRGFGHGQPRAVLPGRPIGVDAANAAYLGHAMRRPGFALSGG